MTILENYSLKQVNTFGMQAFCRFFTEITATEQLSPLFAQFPPEHFQHLILGGGSNMLFTQNFEGLVVKISNKGLRVTSENELEVVVEAAAGENWDEFVAYCVAKGWGGLENLSFIPGQVGSSPIQNIGAYGVELKDTFESLEAFDKVNHTLRTFYRNDCQFGYRNSIFKQEVRGRYVIMSVSFRLKKGAHRLRLDYGAVSTELERMGISNPTIADLREVVGVSRRARLPDPAVTPNAGSFFKNPVVDRQTYLQLSQKHPGLVAFPDDQGYKLSAGWLIEKAGWKGYREGDAGVHPLQALVLVNYGDASGLAILNLANRIQKSVVEKFGVELEPEVNIY